MTLESYIRNKLKNKDILLMTHIVLGYPSFDENLKIIEIMIDADVDLIELQIPFSEPISDGPVIFRANQQALKGGATVEGCFKLAEKATLIFNIPFLIMSYYEVIVRFGVKHFVSVMSNCGLRGAIIPNLPLEVGREYLDGMYDQGLDPILIFLPGTSLEHMRYISSFARGFIYCVARKGVTGDKTDFSKELSTFLSRCRLGTSLPLSLGFGVKEKTHIDYLKGKADIAVIGSQTIRVMEQKGLASVGGFIRGLG